MVTSKRSDVTATAVSATTENSISTPPDNDDASAKQADPDVLNKSDLESLLAKKEKSLKVLEDQNTTLTFDLVREHLKAKMLEKDQSNFRTACKKTANQAVTLGKIKLARLKDCSMKSQEKSKQYLLKAKYVRFKETVALHQGTH
jgi:hypothetical protein